jgi:hypothetical protein
VLLAGCFWRVAALWSILRFGTGASQAVAGEIDAMGVMDEAIEDGVGIGRIADDLVPFVDGDLAGEDGRAAIAPMAEAAMSG